MPNNLDTLQCTKEISAKPLPACATIGGATPLLPAGELGGKLVDKFAYAERFDQRLHPTLHVVETRAREHERQEDVVAHGERVERVEVLKDKTEVLSSEGRQVTLADAREILAVQEHYCVNEDSREVLVVRIVYGGRSLGMFNGR